jgi:small subunit ribosomal protein S13
MAEEVKAKTEGKEFRSLLRIMDKDIDGEDTIFLALTRVRGVDFMLSNAICSVLALPKWQKCGDLTEAEVEKIEDCMQNPAKYGIPVWLMNRRKDPETGTDKHIVSAMIGLQQNLDIRGMRKIKSYKGWRHGRGLKVRGQRQRRTKKGALLGVTKKKEMPKAAAPAKAAAKEEKKK